jgi:hypothetical protein
MKILKIGEVNVEKKSINASSETPFKNIPIIARKKYISREKPLKSKTKEKRLDSRKKTIPMTARNQKNLPKIIVEREIGFEIIR